MGLNKMLYPFEGQTLLERSIMAAYHSIASQVIVVTGAYKEENESIIKQRGFSVVHNDNWARGIGSSVKCGLNELLVHHPDMGAVIVSVCDQPNLTSEIFDNLINTYSQSAWKIVASSYADSIGVPVLYDKSLFDDLLDIPDEHGAKKYIVDQAKSEIIGTVPFPKGEIDIDTIEDLEKITPH